MLAYAGVEDVETLRKFKDRVHKILQYAYLLWYIKVEVV